MSNPSRRNRLGLALGGALAVLALSAAVANPATARDRTDEPAPNTTTTDYQLIDGELIDGGPQLPLGPTIKADGPNRPDAEIKRQAPTRIDDYKIHDGRLPSGAISNCFVDFNDDTTLQYLPAQAINAYVEWPFWNQACGSSETNISIDPTENGHYHIEYVENDLGYCTELGTFGRLVNYPSGPCQAIDPLTEPREGIRPHVPGRSVTILAYETAGADHVPFTFNTIKIVSGTSEICAIQDGGPVIALDPAQAEDVPGFCLTLGEGVWDLSQSITDAYEVRIYARSNHNVFTDIGIATN